MRAELRRWCFLFMFVVAGLHASAQTNGIFADFTTSLGSFTCQLSYSNAPKAVANFIGLATGQRPWLDVTTGEVRTNAFYDGLIFHRVISNFVVQAGSPNGLGTDGPGYAVVDEFNSLLNFNSPWILAMANSGPDSNGSQFFVTVAPFTSGTYVYTVFGRVVSGTNVVAAINHVRTDSKDKPLTNVYIQQVTIRRVGSAALAFDIDAQGLPVVTKLPVQLAPTATATNVSLVFSNRVYSDSRWYASTNLQTWTENQVGIDLVTPATNTVQVPINAPDKFFRMAQVQYPASTLAPKTVVGRTLVMIFSSQQTNTIVFNNTGGGTYNLPGTGNGIVTGYTWSQEPYRGFLSPIDYSGLYEMTLQLNFSSNTNGTFTGTYYSAPPFSISGTFKLTGP